MKKLFYSGFSLGYVLLTILLLPYLLTIFINGADKALMLYSSDEEVLVPLMLMVQVKEDYEPETLKAQAVIARSQLYRKLETESVLDVMEETKEALGEENTESGELWNLLGVADKLELYGAMAQETKNQVLTYNGELKLVPYHEISSGETRDGSEVFHSEEFSYLKSVDSSQDKEAPNYINSTYLMRSQLPEKLTVKARDSAGYVTFLTADDCWLEGEAFRAGMHLASGNFSMQKVGKRVRFLCKGKGHGLGFSQYGGNEMAKAGSSWEEILKKYFPEMEIENINFIKK